MNLGLISFFLFDFSRNLLIFEVIGLIVLANIVDLVMHLSSFKKMVIEAKFLVFLQAWMIGERGWNLAAGVILWS